MGPKKTKELLKKLKKKFNNLQGHISAHAYINGKCVSQKVSEKKLNRDSPGFKEEVNKLTLECTDDFDIQGSLLGEIKKKRTEGQGLKGKRKKTEGSKKRKTKKEISNKEKYKQEIIEDLKRTKDKEEKEKSL